MSIAGTDMPRSEADIYRAALQEADDLLALYTLEHKIQHRQAEDKITAYDDVPVKVIRQMIQARQVIRQALRDGADFVTSTCGNR